MNRATLIGRLGGDVELRQTKGDPVANFNIATNEKWTDKQGQKQEKTEWHKIETWGRTAENCEKYIGKGSQVAVEGSIVTEKWTDKDGNDRYTTIIKAKTVEFLSGGSDASRSEQRPKKTPPRNRRPDIDDDDIPF